MLNIIEENMAKMMAPGVLRGKDWDQNRGNFDGYGWKQRFYLLIVESESVLNLASKLFIEKNHRLFQKCPWHSK